jgi:hypothetical protein
LSSIVVLVRRFATPHATTLSATLTTFVNMFAAAQQIKPEKD